MPNKNIIHICPFCKQELDIVISFHTDEVRHHVCGNCSGGWHNEAFDATFNNNTFKIYDLFFANGEGATHVGVEYQYDIVVVEYGLDQYSKPQTKVSWHQNDLIIDLDAEDCYEKAIASILKRGANLKNFA